MVYDSFNEVHLAQVSAIVFAVLLKNFTNESYDFSSALQTEFFAFFHKSPRPFRLLLDFITFSLHRAFYLRSKDDERRHTSLYHCFTIMKQLLYTHVVRQVIPNVAYIASLMI